MKITFGGHDMTLHPSGALYWPEENLLIASDLHLEKGSHFALRGFFLPPYDSRHTLETLMQACSDTGCTRLLLLGDAFHDARGYHRLGSHERRIFSALLDFNPIWIRGNHDGDFVPDGFIGMEAYLHRGLVFRHEATQENVHEISGHYHPKIDIPFRGGRLSRPCYIEDGYKLILPAFGAYTGGLSVFSDPIAPLFRKESLRLYILGENRIYKMENIPL